jgi:hypothetical protein
VKCYDWSARESGSRFCADLAQLVEQLFRKQQVSGSSPEVGSRLDAIQEHGPKWRNRQTRYVQGVVGIARGSSNLPFGTKIQSFGSGRRATAGTLITEDVVGKDDRWLMPEESPSCTERGCPVKAGEALRRRQSTLARFGARATETIPNPPGNRVGFG